jgi:O-antigen/teichoic acid export membrane protein
VDVLSDSLFNTQTTSLNVMGRIPQISVMLLISRGGRLLGAVVLIFAGEQAPLWFAVARAAATLTASAAAALLLSPQFKNPEERFLHIWRQSLPYGLSEFLALVYGQADITLLALLLGQFSVGLYAPASGIITAMTGVLASGFYIFVPILSRQLKAAPQRFSKTARLMFAGYALVGGLLWMTFLIGSPAIVQLLLGSAYNQTGELMVILSIILFLKSLSFACATFLVAVGWQHRRLAPQLVSAIVNVVLNLWAIPNLGIIGVAWVFVASEVVLLAGYSLMTIEWLRSNPRQDTLN